MRRFPTTIKVERKESEMHHAMPSGLEIGTVAKSRTLTLLILEYSRIEETFGGSFSTLKC